MTLQISHFEELKQEQKKHQEQFEKRLFTELHSREGPKLRRPHGIFGSSEAHVTAIDSTPKVHMFDPFGLDANSLIPRSHGILR